MYQKMIKELSKDEFFKQFNDPEFQKQIESRVINLKPEAVVCFENLQFDSFKFGDQLAVLVGPEMSIKLKEVIDGRKWLWDQPSERQYPVNFWRVK